MDFKHIGNELHKQTRFRPKDPNDHIVTWTLRSFPHPEEQVLDLLDLGGGTVRNAIVFALEGYWPSARDFSTVGVDESCGAYRWAIAAGNYNGPLIGRPANTAPYNHITRLKLAMVARSGKS